jgi:hypothetical protein
MTIDDINAILRNIIRTELGLPEHQVRPANQNAPVGVDPFATVLVYDSLAEGFDDVALVDTTNLNVTETSRGLRKLLVSVQFFKANAITYASRLRARLQLSSAVEKFAVNGLGYARCSGVRVLSGIDGTFWEERAQIELEIYALAIENNTLATYGQFPIWVDTETANFKTTVLEP